MALGVSSSITCLFVQYLAGWKDLFLGKSVLLASPGGRVENEAVVAGRHRLRQNAAVNRLCSALKVNDDDVCSATWFESQSAGQFIQIKERGIKSALWTCKSLFSFLTPDLQCKMTIQVSSGSCD